MVAWLITEAPGITEKVVAVVNYRRSSSYVGQLMEQLYVLKHHDPSSWLEYAKSGATRCAARPAVVDGIHRGEELWCGSGDRYFWARKVDNLRAETDEYGREHLLWTERTRPDLKKFVEALKPSMPPGTE